MSKAYEDRIWTTPQGVFTDPVVAEMYGLVADATRETLESRSASVMEHLLAERIVFSYALVRDREARAAITPSWASDRMRRETLKNFLEAVESQQRRWLRQDIADAAEDAKRKMAAALKAALLDVDPVIAEQLRTTLAVELERVGL